MDLTTFWCEHTAKTGSFMQFLRYKRKAASGVIVMRRVLLVGRRVLVVSRRHLILVKVGRISDSQQKGPDSQHDNLLYWREYYFEHNMLGTEYLRHSCLKSETIKISKSPITPVCLFYLTSLSATHMCCCRKSLSERHVIDWLVSISGAEEAAQGGYPGKTTK